jgi:hypothetical protein
VLAERRDVLHVKFVQRYDAVDGLRAGQIANRIDDVLEREFFRHKEDVVQRCARPVTVAELFYSKEQDSATQRLTGTQELLSLFVAADGQDGERARWRHGELTRCRRR